MRKRKTKSILIFRKVNNYISIYTYVYYVLRKFMISVSSNKIHVINCIKLFYLCTLADNFRLANRFSNVIACLEQKKN